MDYQNPNLLIDSKAITPGKIRWRSPSNIAIIKYWGKYDRQLPRNPSISFTLDAAHTDTELAYTHREGADRQGIELRFFLDGQEKPDFAARSKTYLEGLLPIFPFLRQLQLSVHTTNSFPHSAGIASSASGMSALALCLCSLEDRFFTTLQDDAVFDRKASYVARLGSGSACRSVYGGAALWGETANISDSSNDYAIAFTDLHSTFQNFHDDILLISRTEKKVSSRVGHSLMEQNPFADPRYAQARQRMYQLLPALRTGDLEIFGRICEAEALSLHALMMTSTPPYVLMEPNTLAAIQRIWQYRADTGHPVYFTLDAGPNLHLLYPATHAAAIKDFVRQELLPFTDQERYIADKVGNGPEQLVVNKEGEG